MYEQASCSCKNHLLPESVPRIHQQYSQSTAIKYNRLRNARHAPDPQPRLPQHDDEMRLSPQLRTFKKKSEKLLKVQQVFSFHLRSVKYVSTKQKIYGFLASRVSHSAFSRVQQGTPTTEPSSTKHDRVGQTHHQRVGSFFD
jgi:hypothetical protein